MDLFYRLKSFVLEIQVYVLQELWKYLKYVVTDTTSAEVYFPQHHNWDCGPACCVMLLRLLLKKVTDDYDLAMLPDHLIYQNSLIRCRSSPLWTIDLFILLNDSWRGINPKLLNDHQVEFSMYTTSVGMHDHHREISWYQNDEETHINDQFTKAKDIGLSINEVSTFLT